MDPEFHSRLAQDDQIISSLLLSVANCSNIRTRPWTSSVEAIATSQYRMNHPIFSAPVSTNHTTLPQHCPKVSPIFKFQSILLLNRAKSILSQRNLHGFGLTIPYGVPPVYQKVLTDVMNAKQGKQDRPTFLRQIKAYHTSYAAKIKLIRGRHSITVQYGKTERNYGCCMSMESN
jgi:hypothetical protein